jgi:hypothetical protein
MWITVFAVLIAASVSLGMVNFSIQAKREQAILNSIPDRAAMLSIDRPAKPPMGQPG